MVDEGFVMEQGLKDEGKPLESEIADEDVVI